VSDELERELEIIKCGTPGYIAPETLVSKSAGYS
jgi:hypothetical protein